MVNKKLATLLGLAVLLGQTTLLSNLFAQADSQILNDTAFNNASSVQVASVTNHTEVASTDVLLNGSHAKSRKIPDIFTINQGEGRLPIIIQVLPQDEDTASLFVNGSEILRYKGEVAGLNAYSRAKMAATKLNSMMVIDSATADSIKPALVNNNPILEMGGVTLLSIDAESAKAAGETPEKLAFSAANRLRRVLGENVLNASAYPQFTASAHAPTYKSTGRVQHGEASWYGPGFHGRRTASGTRYNMYEMTAAHRTLPFGTLVRVTNHHNKKTCVVKITDRGPYVHGRIIDLSKGAAQAIGMSGTAKVTLEIVSGG
ncbi:MAG TPA: septal ring lytic transglycosylase RlpA family protein [Oculatellaceae cyanobacterium]|jgi:rare lipoprotein A